MSRRKYISHSGTFKGTFITQILCGQKQIIDYVNQHYGDYQIKFIEEDKPLGTIGALSLVNHWDHNDILLLNADIMCGINYTDFYQSHKKSKADMSLAASDLKLQIPYGVLREKSKTK